MSLDKAISRASAALSLTVLSLCILVGCGRNEAPKPVESAVDPASPESYMNDPVFRKQLAGQREARNGIMKKRCQIEEAIAAETARDAKSPKLKELQAALAACDAEFETNREATNEIVRRRLTQKKEAGK